MKLVLRVLCFSVAIGIAVPAASQTTIRVPADQPSIQEGIDAASSGDTVLVAAGTYTGSNNRALHFDGKAVTLRSEDGAASTTINCEDQDRAFDLSGGEGADTVIDGFTVTRGSTSSVFGGGGILCTSHSSPTIRNCIINQCQSNSYGGGMRTVNSMPIVEDCTFSANTAINDGGGLYGWAILRRCDFSANVASGAGDVLARGGGVFFDISTGDAEIKSCRFIGNQARDGGGVYLNAACDITNCLFNGNTALNSGVTGNDGGGIYVNGNGVVSWIVLCTFVNNDALGSGLSLYVGTSSTVYVYHSILRDSSSNGIGVGTSATLGVNFSDVAVTSGTYPGVGNYDADPLFVTGPGPSSSTNAYYLSQVGAGQGQDSPCMDGSIVNGDTVCDVGVGSVFCVNDLTTRTDLQEDTGVLDTGFHYWGNIIFGDDFESGDTGAW